MTLLIPVTFGSERVWVHLAIFCDKYIYTNSTEELRCYMLTNAEVDEVLPDADVAPAVKRSMEILTRDGVTLEDAFNRISSVYGIPIQFVRELCGGSVELPRRRAAVTRGKDQEGFL